MWKMLSFDVISSQSGCQCHSSNVSAVFVSCVCPTFVLFSFTMCNQPAQRISVFKCVLWKVKKENKQKLLVTLPNRIDTNETFGSTQTLQLRKHFLLRNPAIGTCCNKHPEKKKKVPTSSLQGPYWQYSFWVERNWMFHCINSCHDSLQFNCNVSTV